MKLLGGAVFFVVFLGMIALAEGMNFTDTGFTGGEFFQTASDGENLTLGFADQTAGEYFLGGNFSSQIFDAGFVVKWTSVSWDETINQTAGNSIKLRTRSGNASAPDSSWEDFSVNHTAASGEDIESGASRYLQFAALLETENNSSTPVLEEVVVVYELLPPQAELESPADGFVSSSPNISFSCSASSINELKNITIYSDFNGTWEAKETSAVSGNSDSKSFSIVNVPEGTHKWNCRAADETGQEVFSSANRTVTVASDNLPPVIGYTIAPENVANGSEVELTINATDDGEVDSVWAVITLPDSSEQALELVNNVAFSYGTQMVGEHSVEFFANDTLGGNSSVQGSFTVSGMVEFNVSVEDYNQSGLKAKLSVLKDGEVIATYSEENGSFSSNLLDDEYDLLFSAFDDSFMVTLRSVDIAQEPGKAVGMDLTSSGEFAQVFAVKNTYSISSGSVKINYDDSLFDDKDYMSFYRCDNWNFEERLCSGEFVLMADFSHDKESSLYEFNVSGFSAFGLKQQGFCGDGICTQGESFLTCPEECECAEGEVQQCGDTDSGICEFGTKKCTNGKWGLCSGAVLPAEESCNQKDDNCDGVVDNVLDGNSIESTKCQCFAGLPVDEACNGIDDNCDGIIDSFSLLCGSNIGACKEGVKTCENSVFQGCEGGVNPLDEEICGNLEDDDCDNEVDEGCPDCFNNIMDGDEQGIDCGGSCAKECPQPAWWIILVVAAIIIIVLLLVFLRIRKGKTTWNDLEKRYSYRPSPKATR